MIEEPPSKSEFLRGSVISFPWANFFASVHRICFALTQSGTTANRPTKILWVGRMYYDTTLGLPIWVNATTPAVVWKDAAGNTV